VEIERANGSTRVKMSLPGTDVELDEVLLEFDTALDDGDLERFVCLKPIWIRKLSIF